jgi:nucleoside-diphosphate-sugar epimerase
MTVLITGGTGFVGLNLAEALLRRKEQIVFFDVREPPAHFMESFSYAKSNIRTIIGDVRHADDIKRAFAQGGITHVFHGAAITSGVARESADAQSIIDVNLSGTVAIVRAAAEAGVCRFLFPSSLTVYGENLYGRTPVHEAVTPPAPDTLYGITKYAAERAAQRLGKLWGLDVVAGRIGSVFGPWEGETNVRDLISPFAQVASAAANAKPVALPGVYPKRELIYSRDLAKALIALLFADRISFPTYNLSVNADWTDALPKWCDILKSRMAGFDWHYAASGEAADINFHDTRTRAGMDTARLRDDIGFVPNFSIERALTDYASWLAESRVYFK